jgi:hypothetical protein
MGNNCQSPIKEKTITTDENEFFEFVNCEMQGWREKMVNLLFFKILNN